MIARCSWLLALFGSLLYWSWPSYAQQAPTDTRPFTLIWAKGVCRGCETAQELYQIQFTGLNEAWAIGGWVSRIPEAEPDAESFGYYVLVHTVDGGRTWTEVPFTKGSGLTFVPTFFFIDQLHGWATGSIESQDLAVFQTTDGGAHWLPHSPPRFPETFQFFDEKHGVGTGFQQLLRTSDGGQTWEGVELPISQNDTVDKSFFLDLQTGWVAVSRGLDYQAILRTTDGGKYWNQTEISPAVSLIRDLQFVNARTGWAVSLSADGKGSVVLRTEDGGKTWKPDRNAALGGDNNYLSGVRAIGKDVVFAYGQEKRGKAEDAGYLLYSTNQGRDWEKLNLPRWLNHCEPLQGDLECSANAQVPGFWLLRIHLRPL